MCCRPSADPAGLWVVVFDQPASTEACLLPLWIPPRLGLVRVEGTSALDSLPYPSRLQRASLSERVELTDEHHADAQSHNRCPLPTSVIASEIGTALPVGSLGVTPDSRSKSGLSSDA